MPENKKEKKLPSEVDVQDKKDISEDNAAEESTAVTDKEEDVKAFVPGEKTEETREVQIEATQVVSLSKDEEEDVPPGDIFSTIVIEEEKESSSQEDDSGKTMAFGKVDDSVAADNLSADSVDHTRHFNLRAKSKKPAGEKNRKNLMQNFRVLNKNKEDRAIIEAAPVGDGGRGFADTVKAEQGEDIFEAVEKAYISKNEEKNNADGNVTFVKDRKKAGLKKGEKIQKQLQEEKEKQKKGMIVYGALFAVSAVIALFFADTVFGTVVSLLLSLAACGLSFPAFKNSFRAIKDMNAVSDTALSVMSFFVVLHNICAIFLGQAVNVYTACVIFACFVRICSNYFRLSSSYRFVSAAVKNKGLSILQRIPVKNDAKNFAKKAGKNDEPDIFFCAKAMLDVSVDEPDEENTNENKYFIFTMSFVLLASLVVGLLCFTTQMTGLSFVMAFTATACALLPVMYDPMSRIVFYRKGEEMLRQGACISGREALTHVGRSDGFVLDASDVFSGEVSRFRKSTISRIDQSDSAVFAALLMKEAGSVLAPCFDPFLEQMNIVVPPVENFLYEEKLGYSAWVLDRKILVGNRQMLVNHSIENVPSKDEEKAYGNGRHVMYVVIDGEITATFLVNYKVQTSLKRYSRDFNKTGLVLMLNSKEAFLDEEAVAAKLSIDASSVKILSSKATAIVEKYNSREGRQVPTGLLCWGKKHSIMHLIMGCYNSNASDRLILTMMLLGQLLGFIMLVLSALLNISLFFNPVAIVVFRILWSAIISFVISRKG